MYETVLSGNTPIRKLDRGTMGNLCIANNYGYHGLSGCSGSNWQNLHILDGQELRLPFVFYVKGELRKEVKSSRPNSWYSYTRYVQEVTPVELDAIVNYMDENNRHFQFALSNYMTMSIKGSNCKPLSKVIPVVETLKTLLPKVCQINKLCTELRTVYLPKESIYGDSCFTSLYITDDILASVVENLLVLCITGTSSNNAKLRKYLSCASSGISTKAMLFSAILYLCLTALPSNRAFFDCLFNNFSSCLDKEGKIIADKLNTLDLTPVFSKLKASKNKYEVVSLASLCYNIIIDVITDLNKIFVEDNPFITRCMECDLSRESVSHAVSDYLLSNTASEIISTYYGSRVTKKTRLEYTLDILGKSSNYTLKDILDVALTDRHHGTFSYDRNYSILGTTMYTHKAELNKQAGIVDTVYALTSDNPYYVSRNYNEQEELRKKFTLDEIYKNTFITKELTGLALAWFILDAGSFYGYCSNNSNIGNSPLDRRVILNVKDFRSKKALEKSSFWSYPAIF